MISRRPLIFGALAAITLRPVIAQTWPQKQISFVVPWAAGGSNDAIARALQKITADERINIVVENQPGASGSIGLTRVANAPADGYTIGLGTSTTLGFMAMGKTPLKNQQFDHILRLCVDPLMLVVAGTNPILNLDTYINQIKKQGATIGASGDFNCTHVLAAMTARAAGANFSYVPYAGGPKILTDLIGGHLDAAVLKPADCRAQLESKQLKTLGVYAKERLSQFSEVPTFSEAGIDVFSLGPIVQMSYLVAPAGLPLQIRERLTAIFRKAIRDDRYQKLATGNAFLVDDLTGNALANEVNQVANAISSIANKVLT